MNQPSPLAAPSVCSDLRRSSEAARPASLWRRPVLAAFGRMEQGRLELDLPGGERVAFGSAHSGGEEPAARIHVADEAFFRRCALAGDIGFAESYLAGEWTSPDVTAVIAWFIRNLPRAPHLSGSRTRAWATNWLRVLNRAGHWVRSNSRGQARRNIEAHYDLSNAFFALFLDPSMMYSAARWTAEARSLEEAQAEKNEALCRKLRLVPGDHVLEIGGGWGGWALQAAIRHGCRVTSLTLSRRQLEMAQARVAAAGLSDRVRVEFRDYREIAGSFDKVVSIEMLEAVGHRYLPEFCAAVSRALKPEGLLAMQFITCPDSRYPEFRHGVDFIQKHIFPGSLLLSVNRVNAHLSRAGDFVLHDLEDLGPDYAVTLRRWRGNFEARLDEVRGQGFDEAFIRKWSYYFCYCEAAFAQRNISVVQTVHTRPNNLSL